MTTVHTSKHMPCYQRGDAYANTVATYISAIANNEREFTLNRAQRAIVKQMRDDLTARELQCLELYYVQGYAYVEISKLLHINVSTISRNIQRGERKLNRTLNLARAILEQDSV